MCHPRSVRWPHVSPSLNGAFVSQLLSFVRACPPIRGVDPCVSSHDDITSALIGAVAAKVYDCLEVETLPLSMLRLAWATCSSYRDLNLSVAMELGHWKHFDFMFLHASACLLAVIPHGILKFCSLKNIPPSSVSKCAALPTLALWS
ncbi:unnamed protein product [Pleuronectes platessa]|uniref:Uncharacterized protein n=1 Tax=Pleuronectes platessa TaxID=8262 RepID=A0A9N7YCD5_PLEPL|nr:unnamed protein product [Pleuronectes platessa]